MIPAAKTVIEDLGGFLLVRYPDRKTPDLYIGLEGHPFFCCQCEAEMATAEQFAAHVAARHKKRRSNT